MLGRGGSPKLRLHTKATSNGESPQYRKDKGKGLELTCSELTCLGSNSSFAPH